MINNNICLSCSKRAVCKVYDILAKFDEDAKKDLGVAITINNCLNADEDDKQEN